ncbi:MAG: glutaredoxin domain-containing protein [Ardenticatenaceae bacterium]
MQQVKSADQLIVYGHDYCPLAATLKNKLHAHEIEHEWRDIQKGQAHFRDELKELANGNLSVPTVIFPDGTVMVEPYANDVLDKLGEPRPTFFERLKKLFTG